MSLTPIFDAVLADSEPDLFLAGTVFPRPGLVEAPIRSFLGMEVAPWQQGFAVDPRWKARVRGVFGSEDW